MSSESLVFLMFIGVVLGSFTGFPIAFVLGSLGLLFGVFIMDLPILGSLFITKIWGLMSEPVLAAIPLFIFMGCMIEKAGLAELLYETIYRWLGPLRGGLALATVVFCTVFAATTGIVGASVTAMGLLALPTMLKRGYDIPLATGCICAGGTLGILIPPSIMLIIYGPAGGVSVAKLYAGAFMPRFLLSALFMGYIAIRSWLNPKLCPAMPLEEREERSFREYVYEGFTALLPTLFLIFAVLGTIFFGLCAPTEAAGIGALGSIILAAGYGRFNYGILKEVSLITFRITAMILFVTVGANLFTAVFLYGGGGTALTDLLMQWDLGRWGILAVVMVIVFFLGALIDWIGILLIIVPIFSPFLKSLGFDPLWVGLLICINLQMSFLTPPFAYAIFYLKGISPPEVQLSHIIRGVTPYIALQATGLFLCILFPQICLWLPSLMGK
jgi:tripartite ATP-independent transporter DctM subunit